MLIGRTPVEFLVLVGLSLPCGTVVHGQSPQRAPYTPLPAPILTIGAEGDADHEFVRIGAALRLPTGDIAVADWRTPNIRLFDAAGRLIRKVGREGAGPGEFRGVHTLFLAGDTLIAYDWHLRRLTRFLATGTLVDVQLIQPDAGDGRVDLAARLASGRWLVNTPHSPDWTHGPGVYRETMRIGTVAASGTGAVRWVGNFPGMTYFAYMPGSDKTQWAVGALPVSATTLVEALGDTVVVGDTGTPELLFFLPDGRSVGRLALPLDPPTDLRHQRRAARDEDLARGGGKVNMGYVRASFEAPRSVPRYRDVTAASDHRVWIRLFEERPTDSTRYLVLDPAGAVRARVSLPPRTRVLTVQTPWVLVALRDVDDVERVGVIRWPIP